MNQSTRQWLLWTPRVVGILMCLFLSLFALDVFEPGVPLAQALLGFAVHVAPMALMLVVVALSWRWEWIGGVIFTALAGLYAVMAGEHFVWTLEISGPLLLVGVLFLWDWRHHAALRAAR
jgi:hypothetical protein